MIPSLAAQIQTTTANRDQHHAETDALDAALLDMTAAFSSDLANHLIEQPHDTFSLRPRVLRQLADHLAVMRARDASLIVQSVAE